MVYRGEFWILDKVRNKLNVVVPNVPGGLVPGTPLIKVWKDMDLDKRNQVIIRINKLRKDLREICKYKPRKKLWRPFKQCYKGNGKYIGGINSSGINLPMLNTGMVSLQHTDMLVAQVPEEYQAVFKQAKLENDIVCCHNNLTFESVFVDDSFNVVAVAGWQYAGFYPKKMETEVLPKIYSNYVPHNLITYR